jgi:hypothetical protein
MDTTRRQWIKVAGIAVGALAAPASAWADRLRILGDVEPNQPFALGQVSPDLQRFLAGIRVGDARLRSPMTVFWLHGTHDVSPLDVATLEEARARGDLVIAELAQATVPELVVENRGKPYVLLLAGEILLGGKQNRVLKEDILLPPSSGRRSIGVYCVEQGRWSGRAGTFDTRSSFAAPELRSRVMDKANQSAIWAEVDKYSRRVGASSTTQNYQEVYEKPDVKKHLATIEQNMDSRAAPGAIGGAVFIGSRLTGLDLFQDAGLFARQWPKLLRAHALEAYGRPAPGVDEKDLRRRMEALLLKGSKAEGVLRGNAGVGQIFETRLDGLRASALVFDGGVPHAAIL